MGKKKLNFGSFCSFSCYAAFKCVLFGRGFIPTLWVLFPLDWVSGHFNFCHKVDRGKR